MSRRLHQCEVHMIQRAVLLSIVLGTAIWAAIPAAADAAGDVALDASGLLDLCTSPVGTETHNACLVIIGSFMDGIDAAAISARNQHKQPSICLPPDLGREVVIQLFAHNMRLVKGAADHENASLVLAATLEILGQCR